MVKILFLQFIYGIVDKAMEMELHSNIRFINFLDYPGTISDARTIWLFRDRISSSGRDKKIQKAV
jgi:IS5 family transposase